jgi:hypothetical protein
MKMTYEDLVEKYGLKPYCYSGVNDGWIPLLDKLIWNLLMEDPNWDIKNIAQIKEKFGGLRFYVDNANEKQDQLINQAEVDSYKICEFCGTRDEVKTAGKSWIKTLCEKCREEK